MSIFFTSKCCQSYFKHVIKMCIIDRGDAYIHIHILIQIITRCTQREQNARLHVTSLSSDIKYCKEDNKIKPNM